MKILDEELDSIALVQQLRAAVTIDENGESKPAYREWTAYEGFTGLMGRRNQRFTTGPLAGSAGVAAQRVFWNEQEQHLILFVNFGPRTTGWPNVVHGGAIFTIFDEALGRLAIRTVPAKTAVTATLDVSYLEKVEPGQWFVIMAGMDDSKTSTDTKRWVSGILACCNQDSPSKEGDEISDVHPHATAQGLFVVPKGVELPQLVEDF